MKCGGKKMPRNHKHPKWSKKIVGLRFGPFMGDSGLRPTSNRPPPHNAGGGLQFQEAACIRECARGERRRGTQSRPAAVPRKPFSTWKNLSCRSLINRMNIIKYDQTSCRVNLRKKVFTVHMLRHSCAPPPPQVIKRFPHPQKNEIWKNK